MGARFIGAPVYDPYFNVFALPLVATLADLALMQRLAPGRMLPPGTRDLGDLAHR
jgi:hypothetical protein